MRCVFIYLKYSATRYDTVRYWRLLAQI